MQKIVIAFFLSVGIIGCTETSTKEPYNEQEQPKSHTEYVGAESCKECHKQEHADWEKSDHFFSMQKATSQFVKADFNTSFTAEKIQYTFHQKDSIYLVDITDQNEPTQTFEVAYTFGWEPLQQYLLKAENGKFQTLRATWDTEKNVWFHQSAGTIVEPHDWLSWSRGGQNWNTMCSSCHSTHLKKNYNEITDSFSTTFSEINVACESCHGPGGKHLDYQNNPSLSDPYEGDVLLQQKKQIDNCGACHARRTMLEDVSDPSNEFLHRFIPQNLTNAFYEADGQIEGEDFVYGSFLSSKMYRNHVSCNNCHNPHSGNLKMEGNALCMQCHEPKYDSKEHHHHEGDAGSEGTSCVSCHMDGKVYMGNDYRKDHSFRVPRPDQSVHYGTTNACNSCHTDKSAKWAATQVTNWYGMNRAYHFSDDLIPGSLLNGKSFMHLSNLMKNDSVPVIVKSTALEYLQYINSEESYNLILKSLQDKEALVRQSGYASLLSFPEQLRTDAGLKGLRDKVKAVRIMAFRTVSNIDVKNLNPTDLSVWNQVNGEYFVYLKGNADFPNGQTLIGEYYMQQNDYHRALAAFNRALKMDSLQVSPYTNLAILYSGKNESTKVKEILKKGIYKFPDNAQMYYFVGLNEGALGNIDGQISGLKTAYNLDPANVKYAYNYILTLYETKEDKSQKEAIRILSDALKLYPNNQKLLELYRYMVKK